MKHLGDITKISGYSAPPVDVVIGGSPCQDLSVAGKRAGLDGERSGLYMEQIRIINELRECDAQRGRTGVDIRPRYMVWENVPGAFSSNKGEDFRIVLEEAAKVADENAAIPMPDKGKWTSSGCIVGDGWSIAWRVLDAQFWGVPQRRRRIALVADFGGQSAPEILFVRKSVSGDSDESQTQGERATSRSDGSVGIYDDTGFDGYNGALSYGKTSTIGVNFGMSSGRNGVIVPITFADVASTLRSGAGAPKHNSDFVGRLVAQPTICYRQGGFANYVEGEVGTLKSSGGDLGGGSENLIAFHLLQDPISEVDKTPCLSSGSQTGQASIGMLQNYIVRRHTPLEGERLQGFPDGWTDIGEWIDSNGKKRQTSDAARYKALGNSIAIPPWKWVLKRLCACYERDATMASLFDGIGGFPYIWEQLNGKGTCLWASEIEEFPMAVTKVRFGGD